MSLSKQLVIEGLWYGRSSSQQRQAYLNPVDGGRVQVADATDHALLLDCELAAVTISSRLGNTARHLYFKDGQKFETNDNDAIDKLILAHSNGHFHNLIYKLESHWRLVFFSVLLLMAFVWSATQYGLPLLSKQLAFSLPVSLSNQAASQTLRILDETLLSPSMLSQKQRQAIRQQFQPFITAQAALPLKIQFRHGGEMGPNAFALPDGTIVFTDELVQLASADEELIAVLAHEAGHVAHRHGTRAVIQNSLLLFLAMAIIGDSSGIAEVFMGFPLMMMERSYSRDFEREADSYALTYMQANNIELSHFVSMLERIELSGRCQHYFAGSGQEHSQQLCLTAEGLKEVQQHGWVVNQSTEKNEWHSYLSTHPDNAERRARFSQ